MKTSIRPALILTIAAIFNFAHAAEYAFTFDDNGNLLQQFPASLAVPQILAQPQSQVAKPGELASFFVVAADTRSLSYQWRFYGTNLSGATSDALLLTNVSAFNEGPYSVVLVNSSGSVTSAPAMLWIDSDGDGLPDTWEQSYFGGLGQNPTGDSDGDGISNLDEFNDGTNPTNSASAQFRLTLLSDGGQVAATPTKLSYTNGELVTVTVTALPGEAFHIWSGNVVTRTNPLTLVMTNNKTLFAHFGPIPFTWTNTASGDWHNPTNWSYHLVPTALDNAVLPNNVAVTADAPADCHGLTLTAGTLTGTSNITLHGDSVWTGGTMAGSGRTIIAPGATFTISSAGFNLALERSLENGGTVVWTGNPTLTLANGVITNRAGALFHVQNATTLGAGAGAPRIDNAGTFRKSSNGGTTTFNIPFNNYGDLDLQIGTLHHSGSFLNNGSVAVAAGATQRMAGGGSGSGTFTNSPTGQVEWTANTFTLNSGAQLNGAGQYRINGGTLTCNADAAVQLLDLSGTLNGSGLVTISNAMNWAGGTITGSGLTIIAPGATLNISSAGFTLALDRSLENGGTVVWTGNPGLNLANGVITNRAGALFHVQNATTLGAGAGAPRIDNAGTFRKSSNSGTTTFNIPFNNYGDLDLQIGTLHHSASFLNNGSVAVAAGATQRMAGGGSGSGTFTNSPSGLVEWTANTFTLNSGAQLNGAGQYRINGGTLTCNADAAVQLLDLSGTLNGSGLVTISNAMNWTGGTMGGSGRTFIAPGATLTINSPFFTMALDRVLENGGTVVWPGAPGLNVNNVITNRTGALFHVQNAATLNSGGGAPRFDNAGTFRKSSNSGTATFNIPLNNYGDLDLQIGTLHHNGSFLNNGSVAVAAGATQRMAGGGSSSGMFTNPPMGLVEWTANTFTLNPGAQLNGAGQYRINGGTLTCNTDSAVQLLDLSGTLNGSGVVTISNAMSWTGGTMGGSGRTIIALGATLTINSPFFTMALERSLENGGTVVWPGAPGLNVNNVVITNRPGALFDVQNAATLSSGGGSPRFDNAGKFRKSTNSGTATFNIPLNNYGDLDLQIGTLHHGASFLNNGSVAVAAGATQRIAGGGSASGAVTNSATALVEWTGGAFTLNTGAQLNGSGLYKISGGTVVCNPDLAVANLDLNSTLDGTGILTVTSLMNWTGGTMTGSGRTVIAPGATLNMAGPFFTLALTGRALENGGTVLWTGASYYLTSTIITNRTGALFDAQNAASFIYQGGTVRFDNAGTFRKSVNTGTTTFNSGVPFNNYGTVDIRNGILAVNGGFTASTSSSLSCALGGTTAGTGYGQLQKSGTITLDGTLSVQLLPGFTPATNDTFTVVSAGTRSGTFSNFTYPSNRVAMTLSNTTSEVILRTTDVYPVPQPVLLTPQLSGTNILLTWAATSNVSYRLEQLGGVNATNWTAIPGDVTTPSNTASKFDALTSTNRFYRVRVLP